MQHAVTELGNQEVHVLGIRAVLMVCVGKSGDQHHVGCCPEVLRPCG